MVCLQFEVRGAMLIDFRCASWCVRLATTLAVLGMLASCGYSHHPAVMAFQMQHKEMPLLPKKIAAETLRIDGSGLQAAWVLDLLSERNVQMVEISPTPSRVDPQRTVLAPNAEHAGVWLYPVAPYMFVQLRLSHDGDSTCVADKDLPYDMQGQIRRAPFLPNTCLSLTISPKSTARFHLRYNPNHERGAPFAKWEIFDHLAGTVVGSLTTADEPNMPTRTSQFSVTQYSYVALAALVDNRDAPRSPPYQIYQYRDVRPMQYPRDPDSAQTKSNVSSTSQIVEYTDEESKSVFGWNWERALDEAKLSGWGIYDRQLVDQQNGAILRLRFEEKFRYEAYAADAGFYVLSSHWKVGRDNWLSRYDPQGKLIWEITIAPPNNFDTDADCGFVGVRTVHATSDELILEGSCSVAGKAREFYNPTRRHQVRKIIVKKRDIEAALASP
jgi:hypothetical protein